MSRETLLGAAARVKRRAGELHEAEARATRLAALGRFGQNSARDEARELVHALSDAQQVFGQLLAEKQREYGVSGPA